MSSSTSPITISPPFTCIYEYVYVTLVWNIPRWAGSSGDARTWLNELGNEQGQWELGSSLRKQHGRGGKIILGTFCRNTVSYMVPPYNWSNSDFEHEVSWLCAGMSRIELRYFVRKLKTILVEELYIKVSRGYNF